MVSFLFKRPHKSQVPGPCSLSPRVFRVPVVSGNALVPQTPNTALSKGLLGDVKNRLSEGVGQQRDGMEG